ncbi:hypothetical protein [Sphingosinicella ginsenosidimutans]|uniref:HprK-related kinase A n=1 Tax=Allosphingosinicella ginsenosidimutans TaxID=1176539 RepID=A0A5C6TT00_9SPHN|nr:hypothetical protein [Sphingosinicella ginsenosidimutans]TXC63386.1 hypothetical protein FRZ32_06775 [Sphingosinicella ginsenosidimutans]
MAVEELERQPVASAERPADLVFNFGPVELPDGAYVDLGPFRVGKGWIFVRDKYLPHLIDCTASRTRVTVEAKIRYLGSTVVRQLIRPIDHSYNDVWRRISKRFYYVVFNQALQLHQLQRGQTLVHASSCANRDGALLLMAWGGIGKTSSLIQLLNEGSWQFLSDDLGIIDREGQLFRSPLKMQIYPYSLAGEDELSRGLMRGRSIMDRAQWVARRRLLGPKSVRRRVHPEDLFGKDRGAVSAPVTRAIMLRRSNVSQCVFRAMPIASAAEMSAHILEYELQLFGAILAASAAAGTAEEGFGIGLDQTRATALAAETIASGLAKMNARVSLLDIPLQAKPADLLAALTQYLNPAR